MHSSFLFKMELAPHKDALEIDEECVKLHQSQQVVIKSKRNCNIISLVLS